LYAQSNFLVSQISSTDSNITIQSPLIASSNVNIQGSLNVNQITSSNIIYINSGVNVLGDSTYSGVVTFNSNVVVKGNFNIENLSFDSLALNSNLNVGGNSTFNSNAAFSTISAIQSNILVSSPVIFSSNVLFQGQIEASQLKVNNFTWESNLEVYGNAHFHSNVNIDGLLSVNGFTSKSSNAINFDTAVVLSNILNAYSNSIFQGAITASNSIQVNGDANFLSNVNISGPVTVNKFYVNCNATFSNYTVFNGPIIASNSLTVSGTTTLSNVNITGALNISSNLLVSGITNLLNNVLLSGSNLYVSGSTVFAGPVAFSSNIVSQGTSFFNSNVTLSNALITQGNASFASNLQVNGQVTLGSNLLVQGSTFFNSNVTLSNALITQGNASFLSNFQVNGLVDLQSNLYVQGTSFFSSNVTLSNALITQGNASFLSNFQVNGQVTLGSNLLVQGSTFFNSNVTLSNALIIQGNASFASNVQVNGQVTLGSNLYVQGTSFFSSNVTLSNALITQGNASFASNVNIIGSLFVNSNVTLSNDLYSLGTSVFNSNATFSNEIIVLGDTILQSNLYVDQYLIANDDAIFSSNVNITGITDIIGNTYLHNNVIISSNFTLSNDARILGSTIIDSNLIIGQSLNVGSDARFMSNVIIEGNLTVRASNLITFCNVTKVYAEASFLSNIGIYGYADLQADVRIDKTLTVAGETTLSNILNAYGDAYFASNVYINGYTIMNKDVTMSNNLNLLGSGTIDSNLIVYGETTLVDNVTLSNILNVQGSTIIQSNLDVYGDVRFHGSNFIIDRSCMTVFDGTVSFSNPININSNIYFNDGAYIENRTYLTMSNDYIIYNSGIGEIINDQQTTLTDLVVNGNVTFCNNALVNGVVIFGTTNSNVLAYSNIEGNVVNEIEGTLVVDENLYVGGRLFVNGFRMTTIESVTASLENLNVYGAMTLCNTFVQGQLILGSSSNWDYIAYSNINDSNLSEFDGSVVVDSNLYVGGKIFCNGFSMTSIDSYTVNDMVVMGTMTLCNTDVYGVIRFGPNSNNYHAFSNINETNYTEFDNSVVIDSNLYVDGIIYCNGFHMTSMQSYLIDDAIITGTMTLCNAHVEGVINFGSSNYLSWSNVPEPNYTEMDSSLVIDSNLYVGGRIFCNGFSMTAVDTYVIRDAIIYGTMTLCNTDITGVVRFGASNNDYLAWSNIHDSNLSEFDGSVVIDSNLYVSGRIYCNGFAMTALESYVLNDVLITGTMTLCNTHVEGVLTFGGTDYITFSNYIGSNLNITDGSQLIDENLYVRGKIYCSGFEYSAVNVFNGTYDTLTVTGTANLNSNVNLGGNINLINSNNNTLWKIGLHSITSNSADLILHSANNTVITFTDNFTASVLNFTAKHHCTWAKKKKAKDKDFIGKIVISTGKYKNLNNKSKISIDEAVPIVCLSKKSKDSRVFGVISSFEKKTDERNFKIGNLKFTQKKDKTDMKVIVNASGEGAVWVTNINGNLKNGDLICTSDIAGYGMKQDDPIVYNYTVAKITCSCNFNLKSKKYRCEEINVDGITYKKAFVGCVYKL
jgi:predicted acyltransferase (DUF342 family)